MIYLVIFAIAIFLFYVAEKEVNYVKRKTNKYHNFCIAIGILILASMAGLRALSVGTDVTAYGYRFFWAASQCGFSDLENLFSYSVSGQTYEKGYVLFNFIVSRVTNSLNIWLFCLALATLVFVYKALSQMKDRFPLWLGMLAWLLLYYNESLNLMRQSLAGAIILFAFPYIEKRKPFKYFIWILIATMFHSGAIVAIVFYIISVILNSRFSTIKQIMLVLLSIAVLLSLQSIMTYFVNAGFLSQRYLQYVNGGNISLYVNGLIIRSPILAVLIWKRKEIAKNIPEGKLLMTMFFMETVFIQAISLSDTSAAYRLAAFFGYGRIILFPQLHNIYLNNSIRKMQFMRYFIIAYMFVWWAYYILLSNANATLPYHIGITFV